VKRLFDSPYFAVKNKNNAIKNKNLSFMIFLLCIMAWSTKRVLTPFRLWIRQSDWLKFFEINQSDCLSQEVILNGV
jgi:hypothetical protein